MSAWIDELGRLADEYAEHKRNEGIYDASFIAHRQAALAAEEAAEARAALLAHAAQAERDAPVELPEPDGWLCWTCETNHVAFCKYEPKAYPRREQAVRMSRVMQYGDAREAAGYARGLAQKGGE